MKKKYPSERILGIYPDSLKAHNGIAVSYTHLDSDRRKEKDDYDGTDDTLRTDSVGHAPSQEVKELSLIHIFLIFE